MTRPVFLLVMIAIAALILVSMWFAWRARRKRGAAIAMRSEPLTGAIIAEFARVFYVSTTPAGSPFERLAIPNLSYRGYADITVRADGVVIRVTGEQPVNLAAGQLRGTDTAQGRIGKVVDREGLAILRWQADDGRELESSFRFEAPEAQRAFAQAVRQISDSVSTSLGDAS